MNILLLWGAAIDTQRSTQTWLTYKQAQKLGGQVRKGETGTTICYADSFIPKAEKERAAETGGDPSRVGFLKRYTVFNADQCEGLSDEFYEGVEPLPEAQSIPVAEQLISATQANFNIGGDKAFYSSHHDCIQVPPQPAFFEQINYYRTCFHELGHWTGHKSRLDRPLGNKFGSHTYAKEELTVTMMTSRKVRFVPNEKKTGEKSPDYFVKSGKCDLGVAWNETSEPEDDREPVDYISVKFDGPELDKPFNAALFDREDGADLVWTRAKPQ